MAGLRLDPTGTSWLAYRDQTGRAGAQEASGADPGLRSADRASWGSWWPSDRACGDEGAIYTSIQREPSTLALRRSPAEVAIMGVTEPFSWAAKSSRGNDLDG